MSRFTKRDKSKTALAKIASTNSMYDELANTTVGDLALRVQSLENVLDTVISLTDNITELRNEINVSKNENLAILQNVQSMFNEINLKTISNEKTALQIQTIDIRLSLEIANAGIII